MRSCEEFLWHERRVWYRLPPYLGRSLSSRLFSMSPNSAKPSSALFRTSAKARLTLVDGISWTITCTCFDEIVGNWLSCLIEDATSLSCFFTWVCSAQNGWCWNGQGSVSYHPTCVPPVNFMVIKKELALLIICFFLSFWTSFLHKKKSIWSDHCCNFVAVWTWGSWWSLSWSPDTITRSGMLKKSNISEDNIDIKRNKDGGQKS